MGDKTKEAPQDQADEIITRLFKRFREWSRRGFGPDDVTWCEVRDDILQLIDDSAIEAQRVPKTEKKDAA
jgi:hypothetical protein